MNLSYCRFQNTVPDVKDCAQNIYDSLEEGEAEDRARTRLIMACYDLIGDFLMVDEEGNIVVDIEMINDLPREI